MIEICTLKEATDYDHIIQSALKCKNGVLWKDSSARFYLNVINEACKLSDEIQNGTYKPRPPSLFYIHSPKERKILSVSFRDRVYQRSLNDNILYPIMTKSFIYDNCACQKNKGTDFGRNRLKKHLIDIYRRNGIDSYILQMDIKGYYPNMQHYLVEEMFRKKLEPDVFKAVKDILNSQYGGDVGYYPGSQLLQIVGISFLNPLDHFIKEQLHIKYYVRYMDDLILLHESKEYLEYCLEQIKIKLQELELTLNLSKTRITTLKDGVPFLGFNFCVTNSGKIIKTLQKDAIKRQKRHIRNLLKIYYNNKITEEKLNECLLSIFNHASKGNTYYYIEKLNKYILKR